MSWSVHRDCALEFDHGYANRYLSASGVFKAAVPPRAILALLGDYREQEVVVNSNMLRGCIELVEEVAPSEEHKREVERVRRLFSDTSQ